MAPNTHSRMSAAATLSLGVFGALEPSPQASRFTGVNRVRVIGLGRETEK